MESNAEKTRKIRNRKRQRKILKRLFLIIEICILLIIALVVYSICAHVKISEYGKKISTQEKEIKSLEQKQEKLLKQIEQASMDDAPDIKADNETAGSVSGKSSTSTKSAIIDDPDKPNVYLTFDDGPSSNTAEILDILKQYNVKATFFTIAKNDQKSLDMYRRIVDEGHTLGMHSYTHEYSVIYKNLKSYENDVDDINNFLYNVTGVHTKFYRFPGGSSNTISSVSINKCINYLNEKGYVYFDWNAVNGDASGKKYSQKQLVANVMKDVVLYDTSVVLMHDAADKLSTVESLPMLIAKLKKKGYDILPIDDTTKLVQQVKYDSADD